MPWKESYAMDLKKDFVLKSLSGKCNFTELCRDFGISTKTGYKWKSRFMMAGVPGLNDRSRRPHFNSRRLNQEIIEELIKIKTQRIHWGADKIITLYANNHPDFPPLIRSTVERLFANTGLVAKKSKRKRKPHAVRIQNRIEPKQSNELWTVDFKGWWYTPYKEKCEPLTVRDGFTRYILSIKILEKADTVGVKQEFERLFKIYGLPDVIRSDNGPPFASNLNTLGLTKLAVWWMSLGIKLDRIDPATPSQNGAHERMHKDMKNELENQIDGNLILHQTVFDKWRKDFNDIRPHAALKNNTPGSIYVKSERLYDPEGDRVEYPRGMKSRMVNDRGCINYQARRIFIGNPFSGYNIGLKRPKSDSEMEVWFENFKLGLVDGQTNLFLPVQKHKMGRDA